MSHELRTPLNSVISLSGVLIRRLKDRISEEEISYIDIIERNGKNLLHLINDILDISRIEAGKEKFSITTFNLIEMVGQVMQLLSPQAREKKIKLVSAFEEMEIEVLSDARMITHVLQNLIGNAIKFTEAGKVTVEVNYTDETFSIVVTDTGVGIREDKLDEIFEEFRQADNGTSRKFGGTGLGLSIAKKYATLLNGNITVTSKMNEGSCFTFQCPRFFKQANSNLESHTDTIPESIYPKDQVIDANAGSKTLLLVEDTEPARIQIQTLLDELGYSVKIAKNGEEALEIMKTQVPDGIILDLMMPGMDGFELLRRLRKESISEHIPVLIITAKYLSEDERRALNEYKVFKLAQKGDINRHQLQYWVTSMCS